MDKHNWGPRDPEGCAWLVTIAFSWLVVVLYAVGLWIGGNHQ